MFQDIEWYEWLYQIDLYWNVKRDDHILKFEKTKDKYLVVTLSKNWKVKRFRVNRLVAARYIPNPYNLPIVLHLDNNPENNFVDNLKWGTHKQNSQQMHDQGRANDFFKNHHPKTNLWKFWKDHYSSIPIDQYSKEWVFIKTWECAKSIFRETWIHDSSICNCCKGIRKSAGNFIWKYHKLWS